MAGLATQEAGSNLFTGSTKQEYVDDPYAKIQVPQGPEQVSTPSLLEQIRAEILFATERYTNTIKELQHAERLLIESGAEHTINKVKDILESAKFC